MEDDVFNSNNGVNTNENEKAAKGGKFVTIKRTKTKKDFDKVLEKAKRMYASQMIKSAETLRLSIQNALAPFNEKGYSESQFMSEFTKRVSIILDSKSFCSRCKQMGLKSYNLATHVAILNARMRRQVVEEGFGVIQKDISEMTKPVYELVELKKYDPLNLLSDTTSDPSSNDGIYAE